MLPPPVRPPPLRLEEEGTTSLPQARSDPPPPSNSSPPAPHLLPYFLQAIPKTKGATSTKLVPLECPHSLPSTLMPKPPTYPCPTMGGRGGHRGKVSLQSITKGVKG